jgi:hypothetical protein
MMLLLLPVKSYKTAAWGDAGGEVQLYSYPSGVPCCDTCER